MLLKSEFQVKHQEETVNKYGSDVESDGGSDNELPSGKGMSDSLQQNYTEIIGLLQPGETLAKALKVCWRFLWFWFRGGLVWLFTSFFLTKLYILGRIKKWYDQYHKSYFEFVLQFLYKHMWNVPSE